MRNYTNIQNSVNAAENRARNFQALKTSGNNRETQQGNNSNAIARSGPYVKAY